MKWLWIMALAGCASTPDLAPDVAANQAGRRAVFASVDAAADEIEDIGVYSVLVRYNPARCHCPDFEFQWRGDWVRAWATGPESTLRRLQALARQSQDESGIQFVSIRGHLTEAVRRSDENVEFPLFETVE